MITFKAVIIPSNRRKDGTYPVVIRITYKGKSRRLPTPIACAPSELTRTLRIKSPSVLSATDYHIRQMREAVRDLSPFDIETKDVDFIVRHIRRKLSGVDFELDFFEFADSFIAGKRTASTIASYVSALNALERFVGKRELDINDITKAMLLRFKDALDRHPKLGYNRHSGEYKETSVERKDTSVSAVYLMKLAHIYNAAKEKYNDEDTGYIPIPKSPFTAIPKHKGPSDGQKSIGVEGIQRLIDVEPKCLNERIALDVYILSFLLMGANMADLYNASPVAGSVWVYNRRKTATRRQDKAEMRAYIQAEALPYIERLQDASGKGKWWLPALHQIGKDKDDCTRVVNLQLRKICKRNGFEDFTFYSARHTFATLARKAGVERAVIDECLCHVGDYEMADIYAERDWDQINAANRKVIELFKWKGD